jgi:RNA polymerase sigma factor (sigma-70 family)
VITILKNRDLSPLSAAEVVSTLSQFIGDQLVKGARAKIGLTELVLAISDSVQDRLCEQLQEADRRGELNFDEWSAERCSTTEFRESLTTCRAAAAAAGSNLGAREAAINELAESHMAMAKPLAMAAMRQQFEFDDLMNEAFLILCRAAESFDPRRGNRFSSYAKTALRRELNRKSPSRIGLKRDTAKQLRSFDSVQKSQRQQRMPSPALDVYELLGCNQRIRIEIENVRRILGAQRQAQRDGQLHLLDAAHAVDPRVPNPAQESGDREELVLLESALEKLEPLEKAVVIGHFKLSKSFRSMAKEYRKSAATLSDLCDGALAKLVRLIDSKRIKTKPR